MPKKKEPKIPPEFEPVLLVYLGHRLDSQKTLKHAYRVISEDRNDGSRLEDNFGAENWYSKTLVPSTFPGGIISVYMNKEGSIFGGSQSREFVEFWKNTEQAGEWQTNHTVIKYQHKTFQEKKREATQNILHETIDPLRNAYKNMSRQRRRAFIAYLIEYISN